MERQQQVADTPAGNDVTADDEAGDTVMDEGPARRGDLRVLVVDDHKTFAELLSFALSTEPGLECVGTASSAGEAIAAAQELRPDVIVMDIEMPRQDGLAATRRIREIAPESVIAVVSAHRDPEWVVRAAQAGASAFVPKDGSLTEMLDVLRRVRSGSMLVAPSTFGPNGPPVAPRAAAVPVPTLTQRELDVLNCLGKGMPPKSIARVLGISLHTCRGYVKSLHAKLGVRSQLEAVVRAQKLGLIEAPDER
ncbi:response regulator transcription factor [Pseudonocardia acidicola]|uniref:Response regulator transcription factor n=1 Tax=Pseudonocardia acidicola TaxID=2724939 RepID=A0ABX1S4F5_9PSEU|nr:response regulator transcription factor [Pseudonocardia acidicola]NMH96474.1 response regulator transcription factor [Pseudonocardia acidicola]